MKSFRVVWLCAVLSAHGGMAGGAAAQDAHSAAPEASADEEARGFFIAGRASYLAGRYDEALERFERSYEMSGRAELLYNIGTAAYKAGRAARALSAYREFLAKLPDSAQHSEVEQRILELELSVSSEPEPGEAQTSVSPAATPASPPAAQETKSVLAPSLTLAVSGAALVTGVVLTVLGYKAEQRVRKAPEGARWSEYRDDAAHAIPFRSAGIAVGAVGLVGTALSTWWLVHTRADSTRPQLAVGFGQLSYQGSF